MGETKEQFIRNLFLKIFQEEGVTLEELKKSYM